MFKIFTIGYAGIPQTVGTNCTHEEAILKFQHSRNAYRCQNKSNTKKFPSLQNEFKKQKSAMAKLFIHWLYNNGNFPDFNLATWTSFSQQAVVFDFPRGGEYEEMRGWGLRKVCFTKNKTGHCKNGKPHTLLYLKIIIWNIIMLHDFQCN